MVCPLLSEGRVFFPRLLRQEDNPEQPWSGDYNEIDATSILSRVVLNSRCFLLVSQVKSDGAFATFGNYK